VFDPDGMRIELTEDQAAKLQVALLPDSEQKYAAMTNKEIIAPLKDRGVEIPQKPTKAALLDLLAASEGKKSGAEA